LELVLKSLEHQLNEQRFVILHMILEEIQTEEKMIASTLDDYTRTFNYYNAILERLFLQGIRESKGRDNSRNLVLYGVESIFMEGTTNQEIIRHYIVALANQTGSSYSKILQRLVEAKNLLSPESWCGLFYQAPNINYSVLDLELFRDLYCRNCGCEN
jgi:hypothetical protein